MEVKTLNEDSLKSISAEWEKLLLKGRMPSPFCSLDFIMPWLNHYSDVYEPLLLGVFDGTAAKGFMPFAVSKGKVFKNRTLTFCGSSELYSDHLDIIADVDDAVMCLEAVWDFLQRDELLWEILEISLVSSESMIMKHVRETTAGSSWEIRERSVSPYIDLSKGLDSYLSEFNGKHRNTLKRKARKLSEQGFAYTSCAPDGIEAGIQELFELHRLRAGSKGIRSTFCGEKLLSFHKAAALAMHSTGRLWLRFIERDDSKIAAFYGFELDGRLFYYQFGIAPEWESYSPGTVLMYKVIEEAFSKKLREFDFLRGNESYKGDWTSMRRELYAVKAYRKSIRGNLSRLVFNSRDYVKKRVRRMVR